MNRKTIYTLFSLLVALSLGVALLSGLFDRTASAATDDVWYGAWQMGPELDGGVIGCDPGDGYARHTAVYYQPQNRVYIPGARCENMALTSGAVFYFDLATRTYSLTGVSLPVPVSNYQAVLVPDDGNGNGPGIYVIGSRTAAGTITDAVQVYYPETNTVANITSDPYEPDGGGRSPGGVVYAAGKIFVFGGFDGATMFTETYAYDPLAPAGSRWANLNIPLPTPRSYIAAVTAGDLVYAIGGDEFIDAMLTPTTDTLVLDPYNLAAGWQDGLMADLPEANGDAPAVYVDEGYLGGEAGGIFVAGGYWPDPGPYRWVFRYDLAGDVWEEFPELAIPEPDTGRRNMGIVYVPMPELSINGLGDGSSGLWIFGGFSLGDEMTGTAEFFSLEDNPFLLLPVTPKLVGNLGETVTHAFNILNLSGEADSYSLNLISDVTWPVSLPTTVGPVEDGAGIGFDLQITIPADQPCPHTATFIVTAASQNDPLVTDAETVTVVAACSISGTVTDATSGLPIANAYVNVWDDEDYYAALYTDANGFYRADSLVEPTAGLYASAENHQPSFYPLGWPEGATEVTFAGEPLTVDFALVSSQMSLSADAIEVTLAPGTTDAAVEVPALDSALPVPGLPRLDPQLISDLAAAPDGKANFVVVLASQADLRGAQAIMDWQARGEYVYNRLQGHAEQSQQGVRRLIQESGAAFEPVSVINAVIVQQGDLALVNRLAARSDVAQIIANRPIKVEEPQAIPAAPEAIEWNIQTVQADQVWKDYDVTGAGIVVANIDTGVQWDHPGLQASYRGWDGATAEHNYNWFDPYNELPLVPGDLNGHGTHTMGTMVGDTTSNHFGMAPGAQWIACKGGYSSTTWLFTDELLRCADWILAPTDLAGNNPDPTLRPHVVNNSWGGDSDDYWFTGVIDSWRAAGIFPMFSNGNSGPTCETAGSPGDYWHTFSAGASDVENQIAGFSSRGPAYLTGFLKPDITAPGVDVNSSLPGSTYGLYSGTSMASPHVSGAVALLWSSNPELIGQISLTEWVLTQTAVPYYTDEGCGGDLPDAHPNNTFGWGLLDIYAAVTLARAGGLTPEWLALDPVSGEIPAGGSQEITLSFTPELGMLGEYTATLWLVADDPLLDEVFIPVTMTVTNLPVAAFSSNSPVTLGETAVFTNLSGGVGVLSYLWDFGDGATSTLEEPTHLYAETGVYEVTLTVTNEYGEDTVIHDFEVVYTYTLPLIWKTPNP